MATIASLIVDVAANTAMLQRDVQQINTTLDSVSGTAGKMAAALGATFSIGAVVAFAREIITFASDMEDAAAKTGIGVEQLQALNYAASGAGVSVDQITTAVARMSKHLVDGGGGVQKLGLNVKELLEMDPADAFLVISERIAGIENPMRQSAAAMEIFGRSGAELLPAMKADLRGLMEQAQNTGAIMGGELVAKADAFDDAIGHGIITAKAWAAQAVDLIARGWEQSRMLQAVAGSWDAVTAAMGFTGNMDATIKRLENMTDGARGWVREVDNLSMSTYALQQAEKALDEQDRKNTKARQEHTKAVEDANRAHRDFVNWVGEREIEAIRLNNEALKENQRVWEERTNQALRMLEENEAAIQRWSETYEQEQRDAAMASEQWYRDVHDDMARHEHDMIESTSTMSNVLKKFGAVADQIFGVGFRTSIGRMVDAFKDGENSMAAIGLSILKNFTGVIGGIMQGIEMAKLAWKGLKAIGGLFDREGEHANDTRDNFISAHWSDGHELAALLTSLGAGEGGGDLYNNFIGASTVDGVNTAKAAIEQFLHNNNYPGFATGTFGQFLDFGQGTTVRLHGRERVETEAESRAGWAMVSASINRLAAAVERQGRILPGAISDAVALAR